LHPPHGPTWMSVVCRFVNATQGMVVLPSPS
jgi:hypothetical protein